MRRELDDLVDEAFLEICSAKGFGNLLARARRADVSASALTLEIVDTYAKTTIRPTDPFEDDEFDDLLYGALYKAVKQCMTM